MLTCLFYSPIHTREREWISHDPVPRYGYHLYFDPLLWSALDWTGNPTPRSQEWHRTTVGGRANSIMHASLHEGRLCTCGTQLFFILWNYDVYIISSKNHILYINIWFLCISNSVLYANIAYNDFKQKYTSTNMY